MAPHPGIQDPKVLSDAEIQIMLHGDRREVDRVLLTQINSLSAAFIEFRYRDFPEHAQAEERLNRELTDVMKEVGSKEQARERMAYVDSLIEKTKARTDMMRKVAASAWTWALVAFLAFIARSVWMSASDAFEDTHKQRNEAQK